MQQNNLKAPFAFVRPTQQAVNEWVVVVFTMDGPPSIPTAIGSAAPIAPLMRRILFKRIKPNYVYSLRAYGNASRRQSSA